MGKCIVLVGGIASGKTTLAKSLKDYGFRRVITYTTRPRRKDEIDGIDYYFISEEEFMRRFRDDFFAEITPYNTIFGCWYYGSAVKDYESQENKVIVLNPRGVIQLKVPAFVVYLDFPDNILVTRAENRGDSDAEVIRRLYDDKVYFEEMMHVRTPDLHITNIAPTKDYVRRILAAIE